MWLHVSYYLGPLSPRFIAEADTRRCIENRVANDDNAVNNFVQNPGIGDGMCNSFRYASNHSFPVFWRGEILEILYSVDGRMQLLKKSLGLWRNLWKK